MISVENSRNENHEHEEAHELGAEIVGVFAVVVAIVKRPEEGRGDGDFDMLPGRFVDGGEETDRAVLAGEVVKEMRQGTHGGDGDDTNPHDKSIVHGYIIA